MPEALVGVSVAVLTLCSTQVIRTLHFQYMGNSDLSEGVARVTIRKLISEVLLRIRRGVLCASARMTSTQLNGRGNYCTTLRGLLHYDVRQIEWSSHYSTRNSCERFHNTHQLFERALEPLSWL